MNPIHIARDGQPLGRYEAQDVADGLAGGKFLPGDLAWHDGLDNWVPLSALEGLPAPDLLALEPDMPSPLASQPPPLTPEPSWERLAQLGWLRALVDSVSSLLGRPAEVFPRMPSTGGLWHPLSFLLIVGTLTGWVALVYSAVTAMVDPSSLGKAFEGFRPDMIGWLFAATGVFLPFGIAISAFLSAGLFHLGLKLFSKSPLRFETTFRVYCYAWGAASVLQLVPLCGAYIYSALGIYLTIIGLRDSHKIPAGTATAAVLIPFALCCGAVAIAVGLTTLGR